MEVLVAVGVSFVGLLVATRSLKKTLLLFFVLAGAGGYAASYYAPGVLVKALYATVQLATGVSSFDVDVEGHTWPCLQAGEGPVIYLQHGFSADAEGFLEYMPLLAKGGYKVIACDALGHGENSRGREHDYSPIAQANRIVHIMDKLKIDKFHVLGNSYGGYIGLELALNYQNRLLSLVLLNNAGCTCPEETEWWKNGSVFPDRRTMEGIDAIIDLCTTPETKPPIPAFVKRHIMNQAMTDQDHFSDMQKALTPIFKNGLDDRLHEIQTQTLVVWGKKDKLIHYSCAKHQADLLPNGSALIFDEVGHLPHMEVPKKLAEEHLKFLSKIPK